MKNGSNGRWIAWTLAAAFCATPAVAHAAPQAATAEAPDTVRVTDAAEDDLLVRLGLALDLEALTADALTDDPWAGRKGGGEKGRRKRDKDKEKDEDETGDGGDDDEKKKRKKKRRKKKRKKQRDRSDD